MPRLAVLIPCFNGPARLEKALGPLRDDPTPFDIFVVDDGSNPPLSLPPMLGTHPVVLHRLPKNGGIEKALNAGLELIAVRGYDYVARLDAGDISLPGRFAAQLAFLEQHRRHAVLGTACEWVDLEGKRLFTYAPPVKDAGVRRALRYNNVLIHPTLMFRVAALQEFGFYSEAFPAAEDYELVVRIASRWRVANLPDVFVKCESDPNGLSVVRRRAQVRSRLRVELAYFDARTIHSYLGVVVNVGVMAVPNAVLLRAKKLLSRVPI